jgi:ribosomal protein S18 acetylase RimI-like enzyme
MRKSVFYWIMFILVSLVCFLWQYRYRDYYSRTTCVLSKKNKENQPISIEYFDYDEERDFADIDNLMETYKFWLFHGDYKKGECPLYPNFKSQIHASDFDSKVNVPYFIKIARVEDRCVGFITYYISENREAKTNDSIKKLGRIHLVCVDQHYRRLGIARHLVGMAVDFFQKNNCQRAYLVTRPENIRAKDLYHKLGFNEVNKNDIRHDVFDKDPADILVKEL